MIEHHQHHIYHPGMTNGLLLAGFVPFVFNFTTFLTDLYYICLIPPAGYQCYRTVKDYIIPSIRGKFKPPPSP